MSFTKRTRVAFTAAAVTALGAGVLTTGGVFADTATAQGCQQTGAYEVCVTNPDQTGDEGDLTIVNRIREYIQSTEENDRIRMAMYQWELNKAPAAQAVIDDLAEAQARGVDVRIVLGNTRENDNADAIRKIKDAGLDLTVCDRTCLPGTSSSGPMHAKFFAIQRGSEVQVAHTSSNFSVGQFNRHQNMLSITGDQKLYDDYVGYWNRLNAKSWTYDGETWNGTDRARDSDYDGGKTYFYPRTEADPVRGTLEKLTCREGHDRVWVTANLFDRAPVLTALDDLAASGCDVRVIVAEDEQRTWVLNNSELEQVRVLGNTDTFHSQHNKLIITNADYEGEERTAVYAGSHNLNQTNLRAASDAMLRTADAGVYDIYADYYEQIFELAEG